jgi:hypothetical protein
MPDAAAAQQATGCRRGTITPFGSVIAWPVIADERIRGRTITLGAGEHGLAVGAAAEDILPALSATVADIDTRRHQCRSGSARPAAITTPTRKQRQRGASSARTSGSGPRRPASAG